MSRAWDAELPSTDPRSICGTFHGDQSRRIESSMKTSLYFIADEQARYIKIGLSCDPEKRLHELQAGSPITLQIVLVVPALGRLAEEALHQHFAAHWLHREWFTFAPDIAFLIDQLRDGYDLFSLVPPAPFPNGIAWEWGGLGTKAETMHELRRRAVFA